ncbi:MAG TPA: hypothetical protein VKZ98_07595 [Aquaticitalea sp.]|nr:hypothetical protein [Aquaticitalea sp.]
MKKALWLITALIILFIVMVYWSLNTKPKTIETSRLVNLHNIDSINFREYDSVLIEASTQYKSSELKNLMQGEHYRKAWSTPIKVPVVFLDTLYGGMTIVKEGGGKQTQSLKLLAASGIHYTLRSINKNPGPLIPELARTLGLENIVIDGISAQHPYGAIVVAHLAESAGILHSFPRVVFVPKQSTLGKYNDVYGNRLFLLEYETESTTNWTKYEDVTQIIDTKDLQEFKNSHHAQLSIDKNALVRARLFDLVIGDWDRHAKQWGWVIQKQGKNYKAIPLPVDRDNAFFNLGGIIPSMIANKNVKPEMRPYHETIDYLPGLVQQFDVYFLQDTPESVFVEEAEALKILLTDEVIDNALKQWQKPLFELDAKVISNKIKSRRDNLLEYAKGFKTVLDAKPLLTKPLNGSEDLQLPQDLRSCFGCTKAAIE